MSNWKKVAKISLIFLLSCFSVLVIAIVGYGVYMQTHYYRIKDYKKLTINHNQKAYLQKNHEYTALSYNVGFGAYQPDYSFFMDTGIMKDGTETQGKYGKAISKKAVLNSTNGVINTIKKHSSDFILLQEVDTDSTRSYHVNQAKMINNAFSHTANVFANNFHSPYLFYPFNDPHGAVQAGLLTLSNYHIDKATRRQYPISTSFLTKFTDLDRCFSVMRLPVKNGHDLVLINSHMSAYDKGGKIRAKQLALLNHIMKKEYQKGNYVIVGGDFNHTFGKKVLTAFKSDQKVPEWVSVLNPKDLTDCMRIVSATNEYEVPTCRGADMPYQKGKTYVTVIDGYLVSKNVKATATNLNTEFAYSDHNPVQLKFELK
ncbi:endonuclease/exonuclease/phosphatase family protein [Ligilactobacillus ceti]|uniref:Endonuclease-exonuclease-phosphatase family protein n=1 Tax=Ligilactobacillus ceti DSM 22408 TaxID=1122146 RepID=A0A0R2KJ81_9LACO|nr:endonuclease/exonuclease/phosphatase family protein [Ligilactobacillus ceti]KRN89243.1 endonuclease-exonuclease-phosphatase family protein [Ligilactobacillus ceti DSM 22408]